MKTTAEQISDTLTRGYDQEYSSFLYRQMRYAFGWPWGTDWESSGGTKFPDFPDIMPYWNEVGLSRKIQAVAAIALAKNVGSDPEPVFAGAGMDKLTSELLQAFCNTRGRQTYQADGNWNAHHARTFLDGDQLGLGFTRIGLKTNPKTGQTYVDCAYQPTCLTLWDRVERDPARARWVAFLHYIDADTAKDKWGSKVKDHVRQFGPGDHAPEMVRIFEYYDLGHGGKGEPTMALIPGDLDQKPIKIDDNPFGVLPFAHYECYPFPGLKYPIGRVVMQMATQEAINQSEESLDSDIRAGAGVNFINAGLVNPDDMKDIEQGKSGYVQVSQLTDTQIPFKREPPAQMDMAKVKRHEMLLQQFSEDSGQTALDRQADSGNPTLGQDKIQQNRADARGAWSAKQMTIYYQRFFRTVLQVAKAGDVDPLTISLQGAAVTINVPGAMMSDIVPEHFEVLIDKADLTPQDDAVKQQLEVQRLMLLQGGVLRGIYDAAKWYEDLARAAGKDPAEYMAKQTTEADMTAQGQGQPMPMQPQPAA